MKTMMAAPTIVGVITAIVAFIFLRMSFIPSLLLVSGAWLGTYLLVTDSKPKEQKPLEELTVDEILNETEKSIRLMEQYEKRLDDREVIDHIESITENISKILRATKADPSKYTKNHKVFEQYIPLTLKILEDYDNIENQKLTSKSSQNYMKQVKENISLLDRAYSSVLNSLYETDIMESSADITTLNSLLKMEGFNDEK